MTFSPRRNHSLSALIALFLVLCAWRAHGDTPFDSSPLGVQKVLVLPMEFAAGVACPNANEACNVDQGWYTSYVGPPRNSPEQWQNLLNTVAARWWKQATYGQSQFEFTVLRDPQTQDGWWPPPHSFQDYQVINSIWGVPQGFPASSPVMVPDETASVVQSICGNPLLTFVCELLPQYTHLLLIQNIHAYGDQTYGNGVLYNIGTNTSLGNLAMSATSANEDGDDRAVAAILHELGHQAGELSHYGDCSGYFRPTSFNPTLPSGPVECLTAWDVMGASYFFSDFSGYSKLSRGIIVAGSPPAFDIWGGPPFSQTFLLNPLEVAPSAANPNLIRLSLGDLSWPDLDGYFVECRQSLGNDAPNGFPEVPFVATVPEYGVLITNAHEYSSSLSPSIPAHHVERPLSANPADNAPLNAINSATLKPGQSFTDPLLALTVRFNSYVQTPSGVSLCSVSVARDKLLPVLPSLRQISFAGNLRNRVGLEQTFDSGSIPVDIAYNQSLVATPKVVTSLPVVAPWVGHDNPLSVRVHNRSSGEIDSVNLAISIHQPAMITDSCAMGSMGATHSMGPAAAATVQQTNSQGTIKTTLKHIPAAGSAVTSVEWAPGGDQSISVEAVADGPANHIDAVSRAVFQFHSPQIGGQGITSSFKVARGVMCTGSQTYSVAPVVSLQDWNVQVTPANVTLNPGEEADISVHVSPFHSAPGQTAQIPITVRAPMQMIPNTTPPAPTSLAAGIHFMPVGSMTVLARVTNGPGVVTLGCARGSGQPWDSNHSQRECGCSDDGLNIAGSVKPASSGTPVTVEYRSPDGTVFSHVVQTDQGGQYRDSVEEKERGTDVSQRGDWVVQARWSGGDVNDPTESPAVIFHVRNRHEH